MRHILNHIKHNYLLTDRNRRDHCKEYNMLGLDHSDFWHKLHSLESEMSMPDIPMLNLNKTFEHYHCKNMYQKNESRWVSNYHRKRKYLNMLDKEMSITSK